MLFDDKTPDAIAESIRKAIASGVRDINQEIMNTVNSTTTMCNEPVQLDVKDIKISKLIIRQSELINEMTNMQRTINKLDRIIFSLQRELQNKEEPKLNLNSSKTKLAKVVIEALEARNMTKGEATNLVAMLTK